MSNNTILSEITNVSGIVKREVAGFSAAVANVDYASGLNTFNRQTANYVLALTDNGKFVEMNVATANTVTVPLNSSVAFQIGTTINVIQYGAGQTSFVATGGVTIRSSGGALKISTQYSGASLIKVGTDEWYLIGNITA